MKYGPNVAPYVVDMCPALVHISKIGFNMKFTWTQHWSSMDSYGSNLGLWIRRGPEGTQHEFTGHQYGFI